MAAPVLQFKRGLLTNLPGLRAGEPGFTTDSYDLYVGITSETSTNKFFGSHRYWTRETDSTGSGLNLVEASTSGSNFVTISAPATVGAAVTYYFPANQGSFSSVLTNDGSGNLSWSSGSENAVFTGITTFSDTTDNILGDSNTGSVLFDGGIGIDKNVTIGTDLNVQGHSEFVGVSTFGDNLDINASVDISTDLAVGESFAVTGVSTFTGAIDVNGGADISGGETTISSLSITDVTPNGVLIVGALGSIEDSPNLTFDGSLLSVSGYGSLIGVNVATAATIATADIDSATIDNLTFTSGTAIVGVETSFSIVSGSDDTLASAKAIKDYVDALVTEQDLDFAGDTGTGAVDLDSQTFTISGTESEIETSASDQTITIGLPDNVIVGAALTVTGLLNGISGATLYGVRIGVAGTNIIDTSSGDLTIDSQGGTTTIDDELIVSGDIRINGDDIRASDGNVNITLTSNSKTTFAGDIQVGGDNIRASDGNVNISLVSNTDTNLAGNLQVGGNIIKGSTSSTAITINDTDVTIAGELIVGGDVIKASNGNTALTLATTGAVTAENDFTINGNLYVAGNTTQVNTAALTVEDRTIDIGIVNGATPSTTTTWDLGVLFNYYDGVAKKSAVIWEHGDTRFKFASVLGADTNGTDNDTPQLTVTTFAPIEIGSLWVNDCAGSSQVISCTGTERFLENITIDAGTF